MSASQPASSTDQEMDLTDIFTLFQRMFYKFLALCFKALDFIFKSWWIILLLIIGGATFGYFTKGEPSYKSVIVVKSNFSSQAYLYNAIKQFDDNLSEKDLMFLKSNGLTAEDTSIKGVEIEPIIDVITLMKNLEKNSDRTLNTVVKALEEKDDQELFASDRFYTNYGHHKLIVYLKDEESKKDIEKIIDFVNNQPHIKIIKEKNLKNVDERIMRNETTISQLDELIENYTKQPDLSSLNKEQLAFFNNSNEIDFGDILTIKRDLIVNTEFLKNELAESSDTVVAVSDIQASKNESFKNKKETIYPIVLVLIFLSLAGIRFTYLSLRKEVEAQNLLD